MIKAIWDEKTHAYVWNEFGVLKKRFKKTFYNRNGTPYFNCIIEVDFFDYGKKEIVVILYEKLYYSEPSFFENDSRISVNFHWVIRNEIIMLREVKISIPAIDLNEFNIEYDISFENHQNQEKIDSIEVNEEVFYDTLLNLEEIATIQKINFD